LVHGQLSSPSRLAAQKSMLNGAISRWWIELPLENNHFDTETLSDLILHLNFMAREGGENLCKAAHDCAQQNLLGAGVRFFEA
jgi:Tc toxin complex TcA C-terminal TcB-binding domain